MIYPILIGLHVLAAIVWIGGMFFATFILGPASKALAPEDRVALYARAFPRFFGWVWLAVLILLGSGYVILFGLYGSFATTPVHVHVMSLLGLVMAALFVWMYVVPFRRFRVAAAAGDVDRATSAMAAIRRIVVTNLALGLITSVIGAAGAYWG